MRFIKTEIPGAILIETEPKGDERGSFSRLFCVREFQEQGLETHFIQANYSHSASRGTLRGMHYQLPPVQETKLVKCVRGAVYDVVLDLRKDSHTFGKSMGAELSESNKRMMYVPKGCAHGFLTLANDSEIMYFVSEFYSPEFERGVRWDDPHFSIHWPMQPTILSERDRNHPDFI